MPFFPGFPALHTYGTNSRRLKETSWTVPSQWSESTAWLSHTIWRIQAEPKCSLRGSGCAHWASNVLCYDVVVFWSIDETWIAELLLSDEVVVPLRSYSQLWSGCVRDSWEVVPLTNVPGYEVIAIPWRACLIMKWLCPWLARLCANWAIKLFNCSRGTVLTTMCSTLRLDIEDLTGSAVGHYLSAVPHAGYFPISRMTLSLATSQ